VRPELGVGAATVPAYFALFVIGFLAATWYGRREGERRGLDGPSVVDLALVALVLGLVGARAMAVLTDGKLMDFVHLCTDPSRVRGRPPRDCLAALKFWQGGLTFYGGLLLAIPGVLWFARRRRMPLATVADVGAPAVMLGLAIGKLGCFLEGCCYGAPTDGPLGVRFPGHTGAVHPTQLYESAGALALFALLHGLRRRVRGDGELFGWMCALYGAWRAAIELLRGDARGGLGPLSTGQLVSLPLVALGVVLVVRARRAARGDGQAAAAAG
jgi:phosphatidylglycerol:prolipoprotein diacylglycerol transferase